MRVANPQSSKHLRQGLGQGMTEYTILIALLAIALIGLVTVFNDPIREFLGATSAEANPAQDRNPPDGGH